jgi:hypothetical protein
MARDIERQVIDALGVTLEWHPWERWHDLLTNAGQGEGVRPPCKPGVYEVRADGERERLTIGQTSHLRRRIEQGLLREKDKGIPHSAGERIHRHEDLSRILVRWAVTGRHGDVQAELHRDYLLQFGHLPRYTRRT